MARSKKWQRIPGKNWRHDIWSIDDYHYLVYQKSSVDETGWYLRKPDGTGMYISRYLTEALALAERIIKERQGVPDSP